MVDSGRLWGKVGDSMFMGEYHHLIDDKGRLTHKGDPARRRQHRCRVGLQYPLGHSGNK